MDADPEITTKQSFVNLLNIAGLSNYIYSIDNVIGEEKMTKEQFLTLYKTFVLLGAIKTPSMSDEACNDVRKANAMIWHVICGCDDKKSISDYATELGVTEEEFDAVLEELKS